MSEILRGSCLCGVVQYRATKPILSFYHCHCSRCRKASGSAHASNLLTMSDQFSWVAGKDLVVGFDLPTAQKFATAFCSRCGSPVPHLTRSGREVIIPAGSLDSEPGANPQSHIYWKSRASWSCNAGDLPRFDEDPA